MKDVLYSEVRRNISEQKALTETNHDLLMEQIRIMELAQRNITLIRELEKP